MTGVCQNSTARTDYVERLQLYTHTHIAQLQGPQGHLSSDGSHCKEAAAHTSQSPSTHIIVSQYKSFTLHTLTERHLGLEDRQIKRQLSLYKEYLCSNVILYNVYE